MHQNNTALTCKLVSVLLGIMVFFAGGQFQRNMILMVTVWVSGLAFCILLFGIGEIISLLQRFVNNQNDKSKQTGTPKPTLEWSEESKSLNQKV